MGTLNVTGAGGTTGHPSNGRVPYLVENTIDLSAIRGDTGPDNGDVLQVLDIPAETLIMEAGIEVITALSSSATMDLGITGGNLDNFVDGFDFDAASVGAFSSPADDNFPPDVLGGTSDTLVIEIQTQTGTTTGGKIRLYAVLMDISDTGSMTADEVDRDTIA